MTVHDDWAYALTHPLSPEMLATAREWAAIPALRLDVTLPISPGINGWWEPVTVWRKGRAVASMRLTREATTYTLLARRTLAKEGYTPERLSRLAMGLWLTLALVCYVDTPLRLDADANVKPLQDLLSEFMGVDDSRVRSSRGELRLDPAYPRVEVAVRGYHAWDAGGEGRGPFYIVKGEGTPGRDLRTEAHPLTPRRMRALLRKGEAA